VIDPMQAQAMAEIALAQMLGLDPKTTINPEKIAPIVGPSGKRYRVILHGEQAPPQTMIQGDCDVIVLAEVTELSGKFPCRVDFLGWIPAESFFKNQAFKNQTEP
jgi:hypothetical protein